MGRSLPRAWVLIALGLSMAFAGCAGDREPERHPEMEGREEGWDITLTLLGGEVITKRVFPSVRGMDHDGDGLDDYQELLQGTDPNDADTAGNRLLDGPSVLIAPEEPRAYDWLQRGIVYFEQDDGMLEFQGAYGWRVDPTMQDTAGNGILDGDEVGGFEVWILGAPRIVRTDPLRWDTSGEGLSDRDKRDLGLDPEVRDTDGDGVHDMADVNPWVDFEVRLEVESVDLAAARTMWLILQISDVRFQTPPLSLPAGATEHPELSSGALTPTDHGGDLRRGAHNMTFVLTAVTQDGAEQKRLDLFSDTAGSTNLFGAIHALTGELSFTRGGPGTPTDPWPETATFSGPDGDITLRLVPVWPEAWQGCIDEGCRHGAGEFPWR